MLSPLLCRCFSIAAFMVSMLKVPMLEVDIIRILKTADSELLFLFDSAQIPHEVQAKVIEMGFTDPVIFAKLEDKAEGARKIFKTAEGHCPEARALGFWTRSLP